MDASPALVTVAIIIATVVVSALGFRDEQVVRRFLFDVQAVRAGQLYRLFTAGFLHASLPHLLFNMFSFYSFARLIEQVYGPLPLALIYVAAILGGNLLALAMHRNQVYRALGASGGVCGVIFASIFLLPGGSVTVFPIPMAIPSWLFAILFVVATGAGMRSGFGNIGHDAHLGGAIIGLLVTTALYPGIVARSPALYAAVMALSVGLLIYTYRRPARRG
ncbi:MAG: rhomboid family intramembrane serine protease [Candidatus Krumholzibacteriia bacterium]